MLIMLKMNVLMFLKNVPHRYKNGFILMHKLYSRITNSE